MKAIDRDEVQRLLEKGAQLVEVLPAEEYEQIHIKGASSLPLKTLDAKSASQLNRNKPVITYCHDFQ